MCPHNWIEINSLDTDEGVVYVFECILCTEKKAEQGGN